MKAACACGEIAVAGPDDAAQFIVACHCRACQRRSGSPFGAGLYFAVEDVARTGAPSEYARASDSGGALCNRFCPRCGSTVWWTIEARPDLIGVALGALLTPAPPVPVLSLWERSRHEWVELVGAAAHHPLGLPD